MATVTGFVLAGGRSSRMGFDKANLTFQGQTLLQRALQTVRAVTGNGLVVGPAERYGQYGETIEDVYRDCGPLGGIHAAVSNSETELNLFLSVDMPMMTEPFLAWLLKQAQEANELAVVPETADGLQPLCAVYRRALVNLAEQALKAGDYKIARLLERAPVRYITEREIRDAGFSDDIFRNINTTAEYQVLVEGAEIVVAAEKWKDRR